MLATDGLEIEWQFGVDDFDAAERALRTCAVALDLTLTPSGTRLLLDQYLDTTDWAFHQAGFALRVRDADGAREATLKAFGEQSDGPSRRREINEPLGDGDGEGLLARSGPVTSRVRAVVGAGELHELFSLRTERRTFDVHAAGVLDPIAEVGFDATEVEPDGAASRSLRRVELEVADHRALATVEQLAVALQRSQGFEAVSGSKFAAGLAATGRSPAGGPDLGPSRVGSASTLGEVAYAALRRQFAAALANEPGTRLGEDGEALHDMRVATRRMRSALSVFAGALPPAVRALRGELRWVADALGEVRDLDVQIEWLREEAAASGVGGAAGSGLMPVIEWLEAQRGAARARMLGSLDSPRYRSLVETATARLRAGDTTPAGSAPAVHVAPPLLRKRWRRLNRLAKRLGPASPDDAFHDARIRAKRIRYTTEFTARLYGNGSDDFIGALKAAQDGLGRRHDATIAVELLERIGVEKPLPPATVLVVGELAERERAVVRSISASFPGAHRELRSEWRRLRPLLEDLGRHG